MISLSRAFWIWSEVAAKSFGGPAGQIAVMHRIVVERERWIDEKRFLHALNFCMLLPGPEAQQLATYVGWLMHGTRGGLMAGGLFILPGFFSILLLSILYVLHRDQPLVSGALFGIKAAVLAVVIEAVVRIGKRVLVTRPLVAVAITGFVAIFFLDAPFPAIVAGAALTGGVGSLIWPRSFPSAEVTDGARPETSGSWLRRAVLLSLVFAALWAAPLVALLAFTGSNSVFVAEAVFFSKAAVVTFGGAYAVLAYVAQQAVEVYGWLRPHEMLDGLGMAETTPGPLIQVVQFVGFLGAYRDPGALSPLAAGTLGAVVTTWVTYVPCFYWIFLGAPHMEALRARRWLSAPLTAVTAVVVGVILNLAIWFSLHVLFSRVGEIEGPLGTRVLLPELATVDWRAVAIAIAAAIAILRFRVGMLATLAGSATIGIVLRVVGP